MKNRIKFKFKFNLSSSSTSSSKSKKFKLQKSNQKISSRDKHPRYVEISRSETMSRRVWHLVSEKNFKRKFKKKSKKWRIKREMNGKIAREKKKGDKGQVEGEVQKRILKSPKCQVKN